MNAFDKWYSDNYQHSTCRELFDEEHILRKAELKSAFDAGAMSRDVELCVLRAQVEGYRMALQNSPPQVAKQNWLQTIASWFKRNDTSNYSNGSYDS